MIENTKCCNKNAQLYTHFSLFYRILDRSVYMTWHLRFCSCLSWRSWSRLVSSISRAINNTWSGKCRCLCLYQLWVFTHLFVLLHRCFDHYVLIKECFLAKFNWRLGISSPKYYQVLMHPRVARYCTVSRHLCASGKQAIDPLGNWKLGKWLNQCCVCRC